MNLDSYLAHRRRYEWLAIVGLLSLILVVNVTTLGIEYMRDNTGPDWTEAWATEITSVGAMGLLFPFLFAALGRLQLGLHNIRWRVLWLVPLFVCFSLLHVGLMVIARKFLWAAAGSEYTMGPFLLSMVYEMRKDLMAFLTILAIYYSYQFILTRLQGEARFLDLANGQPENVFRNQFLVKMLDREYLVKVEDIDWIQSASNYVILNCGERHYPMRKTLKRLADELDPDRFVRVHRTAIVNLERVSSLSNSSDSAVRLQSGAEVPVSKTYLTQLRKALGTSDAEMAIN